MMEISQTLTFIKAVKKLHKNQKRDLDEAVKMIIALPDIGEQKKGDLVHLRVYKFRMVGQLTCLAYEVHESKLRLILVCLGSHENFYRDLKNIDYSAVH